MRISFLAPAACVLVSCLGTYSQASAQSGTITTVAGNGTAGYSGDGGTATSAELNKPAGIALDTGGNLFVADYNNNVIRKVSVGGIITTIAGSGPSCSPNVASCGGFAGDGGPATSALLNSPFLVAVDSSGNLFFSDLANNRVRKVSGGIITTVAGGGTGALGDGGQATSASLNNPAGVAVDASGNLFIADFENCRVRKVSASGIITTVAGNGTCGFSGDGGQATSASLALPINVALDASGDLFIADYGNYRIRMVSAGGIITTIAGTGVQSYSGDGGSATAAALGGPEGMVVDASGNIFIADLWNNRIREISADGIITTVAGNGTAGFSGDGGPATLATLNAPKDVALDASGNLFISDTNNNRVREVSSGSHASCTPTKLVLTIIGDANNFAQPSGWPIALGASVTDDCGNAVNNAQVIATFSNGDPPVLLAFNKSTGSYVGIWTPKNVATRATLTFTATAPGFAAVEVQITGSVTPIAAPVIDQNGVVDSASFEAGALSPGSIVSIFGSNLASSTSQASSLPLPTTLGDTQVLVGGDYIPLFYASPGQINAIIPSELTAGNQYQVIVVVNNIPTAAPATVQVAAANPGVFTYGMNVGIAVDVNGNLISSSNPATRGSYIVIYCNGLGATTPPVSSGTAAPSSPPAATLATVTVTLGTVNAPVQFAGLTPTLAGLYQINIQVPNDAPVGDQVQLVITVGNVSSVAVNLPVQ